MLEIGCYVSCYIVHSCLECLCNCCNGSWALLLLCAGDRDARTSSWSSWWDNAAWQTTISILYRAVCHEYV